MLSRLRNYIGRFRKQVSTTSSYLALVLFIGVMLLPTVTGELFASIPSTIRFPVLLASLAYLMLFYPQFRVWKRFRREQSEPGKQEIQETKTDMPEKLEVPERRQRPVAEPVDAINPEELKAPKPSERILKETPEIKLASWMEDDDDDDDSDFWSMMSEVSKKNSSDEQ